jgi:lipopolysaccharide/colanic/teichoic acid biosynthesis glycosyltransferase
MFDIDDSGSTIYGPTTQTVLASPSAREPSFGFRVFKRFFDITVSLLLLVPMISTALALVVLNQFLNPGPLFYRQERMGQGCKPFMAIKFRTMLPADKIERGPFDALEVDRITRLGQILRKTRLDELPQAINVLMGEMSLIGPRPDYFEHAKVYVGTVPGYRERHIVRPGISGYAQIEVGYAAELETLQRKVSADLFYIRNASILFDLRIAWRTIVVVLLRKGS